MSGYEFVNTVPLPKVKRIVIDTTEDVVHCRLCCKGFANTVALNNHARMEHIESFSTGDPRTWTQMPNKTKPQSNAKVKIDEDEVRQRKQELLSSLPPTNMMGLASNDVSYIIIKEEDSPAAKKRKEKKDEKMEKAGVKKEKEMQPITGPFECLQPSTLGGDGICHQIFFSCCEYSLHFRDEHTRRRKGLRCQVCEKPLACIGEELAPFSCEVCGEGFQTNEELSEHSSTVHVKLKPYECNVCHKRFTQQGGVLQHMRMHTGDRPYPCTYCPKAFTQKSGLEQHLRIHTKHKPYRCVVCSKSFCQSVHLKQHMRTHTNVAPFQCAICDKRFKQSSHLNYHLVHHNPTNMTEEQKSKYSELIGLIKKEIVEVEIIQSQPDIEIDGEQVVAEQSICDNDDNTWSVRIE